MSKINASHTARVLIIGPGDYVPLVIDLSKREPIFKNLPGGTGKEGETPEETASRELMEETGVHVDPETLTLIGKQEKKDGHTIFIFIGRCHSFARIRKYGDEGEVVVTVHVDKLLEEDTKLFTATSNIIKNALVLN